MGDKGFDDSSQFPCPPPPFNQLGGFMSRVIENDHPFTDDEIEYVLSRSGGASIVAANKRDFPQDESKSKSDKKTGAVELDPEIVEFVKGLDSDGVDAKFKELGIECSATESKEKKLELAKALQAKKDTE
ncbi:hypothetical protein HWB51_gp010 [Mycobacterium phage Cuke]|uniref:Uncharacterized protein n=1 Tax=Mycobacterium phage Cuke TaxID=2079417 RepID=A0A2L1IWT0_9CAUD|nr:hypothetical protein HWB51_gp010 [Mycobacterium phage Cuke]AVD99628.1 hypothetical protein SEA_CUKE_10 [Mycobacterium phage Cuke]